MTKTGDETIDSMFDEIRTVSVRRRVISLRRQP